MHQLGRDAVKMLFITDLEISQSQIARVRSDCRDKRNCIPLEGMLSKDDLKMSQIAGVRSDCRDKRNCITLEGMHQCSGGICLTIEWPYNCTRCHDTMH